MHLLTDRAFGPFAVGKVVATSGTWVQNVTSAILMFELTGSAFMVGLVSAVMFGGPLFLALWAGSLSDRYDRRSLLLIGRLISAISVTSLAVLLATRGVDGFGGPAALVVLVGVVGIGLGLSNPSMQAIVPNLVPGERLEMALAISSVAPSIARTIGPVVGAALLSFGGYALAFGLAALTDWIFAGVLLVFVPANKRRVRREPGQLLRGVRFVIANRSVGLLVLAVAVIGQGADPVLTLSPALAFELGGGRTGTGILIGAFGAGSIVLVGSIRFVRNRVSIRVASISGFFVLSLGLLLVAIAGSLPLVVVGFFLAGVGFMLSSVTLNTRLQKHVPDMLRGRVMALWSAAFLGWRPVAAMIDGAIADRFSVQAALIVTATIVIAGSLFARVRLGPACSP